MRGTGHWRWIAAAFLALPLACAPGFAGESYTEYDYDPDGRLHRIRTAVDDAPPLIESIAPQIVRRGPQVRMSVTGSSLRAALVSTGHPALTASAVTATATKISFDLSAADSVPLGPQTLIFTTALGQTQAQVTVFPRLPVLSLTPDIIALAPGEEVAIFPQFDSADVIDHHFALATGNPAVAQVAPGGVSIPAGMLAPQGAVAVSAHTFGNTALRLETDEVGDLVVPVFVTPRYQPPPGGAMFHSRLLGLQLGEPPSPPVLLERGPFAALLGIVVAGPGDGGDGEAGLLASPVLGLSLGRVVTALAPGTVVRGDGPVAVLAHGHGLATVTQATIEPADGLAVQVLASDDGSVQLEVSAAADAVTGWRTLRLLDAQGDAIPATGIADRLRISDPLPQLDSVQPQVLVRGAGTQLLTLRGERLHGALSVAATPPDGLVLGAQPQVSPDGRLLTVQVGVSAQAATGARTLVVTTPSGSSDGAAAAGNTVQVATGIARQVSPVAAAALGVVIGIGDGPGGPPRLLPAPVLGVTLGPAFTGMAPRAGAIGSEVVLQVFGHGLEAVTSVAMEPVDGITLGAPDIAPGGSSLSLPMQIAADAPRTARRLVLGTATGTLAPAAPDGARFLVTDTVPQLFSVSPPLIVAGAPAIALTLRGRHLDGATLVAASPGEGLVIAPPDVSQDGTALVVEVAATSDAALVPRVLTVSTPAGVSEAQASPANGLSVVAGIGEEVTPIASASVGLVVGEAGEEAAVRLLPAAVLGVVLGDPPPAPPVARLLAGARLGVSVGAVVHGVSPRHLVIDSSVELQVDGRDLGGVDAVSISPPDGVAIDGAVELAPDGHSLTLPVTVAPDAAKLPRRIVLLAGGVALPESDPAATRLVVVGKQPLLESIEPIQVVPGQAFVLIVRGINLGGALAVTATPGTGLAIGNDPQVNGAGTELAVSVNVAANAPKGPRVIRVSTAAGTTPADAVPANTLHIVDDD